ncbi:hypothetical protein EYB25_004024 [Talaromyces marneffei]|nr:hypothetical protein EYB25_004024 [Talaromyces marneffei]
MSLDKPTVNLKTLEQYGINFSEDVYNHDIAVPEHVQHVIEALLDHDIQVPDSLRSLFEKEQRSTNATEYTVLPPQSASFSLPHEALEPISREVKAIEEKFGKVASLARIAREYHAANVSRETWEHFLRSYIFRSFEDSGLQTSRHSKLFDAWTLESNISWEAASKLSPISDILQPTFTYGFPVHIPDDTEKKPTGFNCNENVTNFSLNTLTDIGPIITCPTNHPWNLKVRLTKGQKLDQKDLICFPWALVEVQSATETVEACYCRAATGAYAALSILKQLQPAWTAVKGIPPVIFFTCSGPEIRAWLSFSEFKVSKPSTRCICIYAGTLTATWCIAVLREIIQNMTFWATRVLRPRISSQISWIRPIVSASPAYPHSPIQSREMPLQRPRASRDGNKSKTEMPNPNTIGDSSSQPKMFVFGSSSSAPVKTEKQQIENADTSKPEKPTSSIQGDLLFSEKDFKSFGATVKTKSLTQDSNILKPEAPISSNQSTSLSSEQKLSTFKSSNAPITINKATYVRFRGKKIPVRLPSHDERKPRRVTEADWDAKYYLWLRARQAMILGQTGLGNKQDTGGPDGSVAKISEGPQTLQVGQSSQVERNKEADNRPVSEENTPASGSGEFEGSKRTPVLNTEVQETKHGSSHTSKDQSLEESNARVDADDFIGEYFVYRTNQSFHARSYDAATWESDGENDPSYYTPTSGSEPDSEDFDDVDFGDDSDDEGSENISSHSYDDASIEELLSELKVENERFDSPSLLTGGAPGKISNLTFDDIDDLLYTAAKVISGERFIQLNPIRTLLDNLKGVDLLDATWRSLENWEGQSPTLYSDQMKYLLATVQNINDFLAWQSENSINPFKHHHLTRALRNDELDQTLQRMQKKGDWRLRDLLKNSLESWNGEKCMELLSNELLAMTPEEFDDMLQGAFDTVYSASNLLNIRGLEA